MSVVFQMHMKSTSPLVSVSGTLLILWFVKNPETFFFYLLQYAALNRYVYFYSPDLVNFDDIASSENLLHLTANRPKMPGRRLPGRFNGGHSVSCIYCCKTQRV